MKIEIYEPGTPPENVVIRLRLFPSMLNEEEVALCLVDEQGEKLAGGAILKITKDGCLERFVNVLQPLQQDPSRSGRITEAREL